MRIQAKLCGLIVTETSLLEEKAGPRPSKAPEGEFVILVPEQALGGRSVHKTSSNGSENCSISVATVAAWWQCSKRCLGLHGVDIESGESVNDSKCKSHAASFGLQGFSRCCRHLVEQLCHLEQ